MDTLRRWNNCGKWNDALLTKEEKQLKQFYSKLLLLCNEERALREGLFYDLMPANYENEQFNSTRQFAFLRGTPREVVLVLANFEDKEMEITVEIPQHAFDFFELKIFSKIKATPLLSVKNKVMETDFLSPLKTKLEAHSGEVYKISLF